MKIRTDGIGNSHFIITIGNDEYLQSYSTVVAAWVKSRITLYPDWDYSVTTARHVALFFNTTAKSLHKRVKSGEIEVKPEPDGVVS